MVERDVSMLGSHAFSSLAKECKLICHRQMPLSTAGLGCLVRPVRPYLTTLILHNLKYTYRNSGHPDSQLKTNNWLYYIRGEN